MTTAFQPGAFQSDSHQIEGGVAATDFQVTIAFVQDSDEIRLELQLPASNKGAGRKRRKERYIAKYKEQYYQFETLEELESFVAEKKADEQEKPKREREPIKISLSPDFVEEIAPVVEYPKRIQYMPTNAALAHVRRIDKTLERVLAEAQRAADDEEEALMVLLL